ncbi:MAG: hypothetical protein AB2551_11400 [Candidatus Thiodiazotropha sp.]
MINNKQIATVKYLYRKAVTKKLSLIEIDSLYKAVSEFNPEPDGERDIIPGNCTTAIIKLSA